MKRNTYLFAGLLTAAIALGSIARAAEEQTPAAPAASPPNPQEAQVRAQAQPNIEKQRQQSEADARKNLDRDAVAAIEETRNAIKAIDENKPDEAIAALERATGKINVLLARNPATGLIPVAAEVDIIDLAPHDVKAIRQIAKAADRAVDEKDYPAARVLLESLTSEMRVRTSHLPLATYPVATREAARLLDQKKPEEAKAVLNTALHTLAIIDRVSPLPQVLAEAAIIEAQDQHKKKNKDEALNLLAFARAELDRAKELGYAGKDPDYPILATEISNIEKQINENQDTGSSFKRLKEKVAALFKRHSESEKRSETASR